MTSARHARPQMYSCRLTAGAGAGAPAGNARRAIDLGGLASVGDLAKSKRQKEKKKKKKRAKAEHRSAFSLLELL